MAVLTTIAIMLWSCPTVADTAGRLDRLSSGLVRFVCEIPAPDADHAAALEMLDSLDVDPSWTQSDAAIHPSRMRLAPGISSDLALLHRVGHHLHYRLLPEPMRRYYWYPSECDPTDTGTDPSRAYDRFAGDAAGLFVACFVAYSRVRGFEIRGPDETRMSGMQTSLLRKHSGLAAAYGEAVRKRPTQVYGDFLQATIAYRRRCTVLNLPARTMCQWQLARQMYGGLPGVAMTVQPVPGVVAPVDHLLPLQPGGGLDATINGQAPASEAVALSAGDRVELGDRAALVQLDQGHASVVVGAHSRLIRQAETGLEIIAGQVLAAGPVVLDGRSWQVHTTGGVTALQVNVAGELTIGAVREGATVLHKAGQTYVPAGQVMIVPAAGPVLGPGPATPMEVVYDLPDLTPAKKQQALTHLPDPPPQPQPSPPSADSPQEGHQVAAEPEEWVIFKPKLLPEVVLCHGIGQDNDPEGISKVFAADAGLIVLFVRFDFGHSERVLDIEWTRDGRVLTGRSITAKGQRKFANNLRARAHQNFAPGEYVVKLAVDGEPAAELGFTVQ